MDAFAMVRNTIFAFQWRKTFRIHLMCTIREISFPDLCCRKSDPIPSKECKIRLLTDIVPEWDICLDHSLNNPDENPETAFLKR